MRHLFYIPASYTALLYGLLAIPGLLVALYIGVVSDLEVLLGNNCGPNHWEFWPSISSAIGDKMPERQMWRIAFVLCSPFRLGTSIALFNAFFQKGCGGMSDIAILLHSPRKLLISSAFLSLVLLWSDLWRLLGALVWTMVASNEHLIYHNLGFGPYIVLCFMLQVVVTTLTKRNIHNMNIYTSLHEAQASFRLKQLFMILELASSVCLVAFFTYHKQTCAPGSYSLTSICEWVFALSNVLYDMTAWYELRQEGWLLGGSPAFYRQILPVNTATSKRHSDRGVASEAFKVASEMVEDFHHPPQEIGGADVSVAILSQETGVPNSMHSDSPKTLAPPNGGEYFESDKVVVHTFTICCAPSNIHLWLCDIYWAHQLVEMFIHVVEHTYFQPLVAMALSWEMISFFFLGSPVLLRIASFRRWATGPAPFARTWLKPAGMPTNLSNRLAPMYVFFYFLASFSHLHMLIQRDARRKILGVSYGPFFLTLAVFCRYLYPSTVSLKSKAVSSIENSRRMIYALPLGLVLGMLLRILHITIAPMFVNPSYSAVFGILLGLNFTVSIYREAMFSQEDPALPQDSSHSDAASTEGVDGETPLRRRVQFSLSAGSPMVDSMATLGMSCPAPPSALLGCLMGLMFCMAMTFYNCANYIPRLVAVEPYPASLMVVAVFALGVYFSPDVLPIFPAAMQTSRRGLSLPHRWMQLLFKGSLMRFSVTLMVGLLLLLFATRQSNFTYEAGHPGYPVTLATPKADVKIENWRVQTDFRGSKHVAFGGGLLMTFCVGALFPVTMELVLVHQRARRFLHLSGEGDAEAIYKHEAGILLSFEMTWFVTVVVGNVLYALVISYPFVPMAWIVREKSRPLMLTHFFIVLLLTGIIRSKLLRHKNIGALSSAVDGSLGYRQRMMHKFVAFLIVVAFLFAIVGRVVTQPGDVSYPEGKKTALEYPEEVLHLHDMMIELRKARNIITDPYLQHFEVAYHENKFKKAMDQMEQSVTATISRYVHPRYKLGSIVDPSVRRDIFNAAKAMTFFSGMIWTVHFALDNYNVDSLDRMVKYAKQTEAGVVGLLESDTMHVSNGNRDMVEYLSYYMGYRYTDYGPTSLDNTYGCGIISRYPILKVHRYVTPSPLGELGCVIHAELDVYGIRVHTYVGHFGNTEHYADGLLQSQFLGSIVGKNAGPSLWLGYLVTHPGDYDHYRQYSDPGSPGKFRDTAYEIYTNRTWTRLKERGGFEEQPPLTVTNSPGQSVDFNVEFKLTQKGLQELEKVVPLVDNSFRRTPRGESPRYFYFNDTNRYSIAHPRFEFVDRYCQYNLYKTGRAAEEFPDKRDGLQPYRVELFDWWRKVDGGVEDVSDTEIQVTQLRFRKRTD